ncbi:olfactory receptor 14J1-like [Opisthocomus hoazin]|uniref:olfactory receptor 14J1-like n=1 Tax=Opisthocomus hoazin TaxID=30419 RepID=UPI003F52A3A7
MAYDRYFAICRPLHYGTLLGSRACVHMAAAAWGSALLSSLLHTVNTFSIPLCKGNALNQFFCEIPQILKLSRSHSYLREVGLITFSAFVFWCCFVFIVLSYVQIFRAMLRIPSAQGRHKAFSTCLPHLPVVSLFISTSVFAYLKPPSISSPSLDLVVSFFYSVLPPALNPLIYSMRNQELKDALMKLVQSLKSCSPDVHQSPQPGVQEEPPQSCDLSGTRAEMGKDSSHGSCECEEEEAFLLCKDCSAVSKPLLCYQCWFSYKSKADHHTVCCEENSLHPSQVQPLALMGDSSVSTGFTGQLVAKEGELVRNVKTTVNLAHSDHEIVVSQILRDVGKESIRAQTLDMRE